MVDKNLLQVFRNEQEAFSGFSTTRNMIAADQRALIINWPWYDLKYAIRNVGVFETEITNHNEFYLDRREVIIRLDGKEVRRFKIERNRVIEDQDYPQNEILALMNEVVSEHLDGLDWDEYFYTEPRYNIKGSGLVSREEFMERYGFAQALVDADPEMYRPMIKQTPQSFIHLKESDNGIDGDAT